MPLSGFRMEAGGQRGGEGGCIDNAAVLPDAPLLSLCEDECEGGGELPRR